MSILLSAATHTNPTGGAAMKFTTQRETGSMTFRDSEGLRMLLARLQADGGTS